ncbi:MAG: hypothetical protein RRB13_10315 [bacterium]|nr:hypothetical protein [bacterium]
MKPLFAEQRTQRTRYREPLEMWGNGLVLIERQWVFDPAPNFLLTAQQNELYQVLDGTQQNWFFAHTAPLLRFGHQVTFFEDRNRLIDSFKDRQLYDRVLAPADRYPMVPLEKERTAQQLKVTSFTPEHLVAEAVVGGPQLVIWSDAVYPGWTLEVNGEPKPILEANGGFKSLWLEKAGTYQLDFRFLPRVRWLIWLEWVLFWGLALGLLWYQRKPKGLKPKG